MSVFLSIYDFYDKHWGETALQKKIDEANARAERAHAEGVAEERARWEAKLEENSATEG